jgi:low affinity Fe/Cu permease
MAKAGRKRGGFERFASVATRVTGSVWAFIVALGVIVVWGVTGPMFHFSDTWQLVINTGTTIVTFLMVFLIQQTQNKDGLAMQLKLNELVAAVEGASNRLISVEDLTEEDVRVLATHYQRLAEMARDSTDVKQSHSVEEAERRHQDKHVRHDERRRKAADPLTPKEDPF